MSGFWRHRRETDLERRLRAERPEPPETLVRAVVDRTRSHERRSLAPRLAIVGAVTAVMLAALGAAGSIGYASTAISGFTSSIHDVVFVSNADTTSQATTTSDASKTSATSATSETGDGGNDGANETTATSSSVQPFQDQYGVAICHKGKNTLRVDASAVPAHIAHGDTLGACPS